MAVGNAGAASGETDSYGPWMIASRKGRQWNKHGNNYSVGMRLMYPNFRGQGLRFSMLNEDSGLEGTLSFYIVVIQPFIGMEENGR